MKMLQQILTLSFIFILFSGCGTDGPRAAESNGAPWVGLYVQDIDDEMRDYMSIKEDYGILVNDVIDGSPADEAGLRETDVILKFDGQKVRSTRQLTRIVSDSRIGEKVELQIIRNKKKKKLELRVEEKPERFYSNRNHWEHEIPDMPAHPKVFNFDWGRPKLGIKMSMLNDELAEYFDVDADDGVLVLSVKKGSPAEKGGIKAGDIIHRFDGKRIRDEEDLLDELSKIDDEEVEIEIKRKGRSKKIKVELDKNYRNSFRGLRKKDWGKFEDQMEKWGKNMKDWGHNFKQEFHDDNIDHNIHIEIKMQEISEELERIFETLGEELGADMEHLSEELENIHLKIDFDEDKVLL